MEPSTHIPTILVIDDEFINVRILEGLIQSAGFQTLSAPNGMTGREVAVTQKPDLILLDIMMPHEDGFETCRKLKSDAETTDIPVIFISALADVQNKVHGLEIGAVDYITKPFEKEEVLARIRLHLKLMMAQKAIVEEQASKLRTLTEAQQSLLVNPEDLPEARFAIRYLPVLEAGGDFYDVFALNKNTWCYFVADICGHDLGVSMVTSSLKALVRQNSGPLYTPVETFKNMNMVLRQLLKNGKYLTAQSCYMNRARQELTVYSAGHPPPVFVPREGEARLLESEGDILGAFDSVFIQPVSVSIASGDRLFLYTDGLTERFGKNARSRGDGEHAFQELCAQTRSQDIDDAVDAIIAGMLPNDVHQHDDIVLMGVEV